MSSFIESISQDPKEVYAIRQFISNPFKSIPVFHGGFKHSFHFNFDSTSVKLEKLKKLKKTIRYIPLNEISTRLNTKTFFTIACIGELHHTFAEITDLLHKKFILRCDEGIPSHIHQFDMIALANVEIGQSLRIKRKDQIIKIGHNEKVQKCTGYGTSNNCCDYVDIRNSPHCDFHCKQLAFNAGDRPMLKLAQTQMKFDASPETSPKHFGIIANAPSLIIPDDYVEKYLEAHKTGRAARLNKILNNQNAKSNNQTFKPQIAAGFSQGDIILL